MTLKAKVEYPMRGYFHLDQKKMETLRSRYLLDGISAADKKTLLDQIAQNGDLTEIVQQTYVSFKTILAKHFPKHWPEEIREYVLDEITKLALLGKSRGKSGYISFLDEQQTSFIIDPTLTEIIEYENEEELAHIKESIRERLSHEYFLVTKL